jgi:cobalt-precorrin 5A hydrolase
MTRVVLGLGCDRGTSLRTLRAAVERALDTAGLALGAVASVASIDKKNDEVAILTLARTNGWSLRFFSAEELSRVDVPSPSETVRKYMGTPAVAEAAAILAAATDRTGLLLEKYKHKGEDGKNATVSIASVADDL